MRKGWERMALSFVTGTARELEFGMQLESWLSSPNRPLNLLGQGVVKEKQAIVYTLMSACCAVK